eukprot:1335030-Pyramimonas_sp.AAC.1
MVWRGHWLRSVHGRLQTLQASLPDEGGCNIHCQSAIGAPLASRPCIPYPMPPPYITLCGVTARH